MVQLKERKGLTRTNPNYSHYGYIIDGWGYAVISGR